jgi:hypothetical protein
MNLISMVLLFLFSFFGAIQVLFSGQDDLAIFLRKLGRIHVKGFPYLHDLRYTGALLKNMVIQDVSFEKQEGFSYKHIAVPDVFCNIQQNMEIIFISCQNMPIKIDWETLFSRIQKDRVFTLIVKICENVVGRGQEIITALLESIPEEIKERMTGLDCSECNVESIPEIVYRFPSLRYCRLSHNQIQAIPENFFLCLTKLKWFFVSNNRISVIPLLQHDHIKVVDFAHNQLLELRLGVLPQLRYLNVVENNELKGSVDHYLKNAPELNRIIIPACGYEFLQELDLTKYQVQFSQKCIEITT